MNTKIIAYYLPQYHPIPENDLWWGKGFTEWTNVGKAKPLFKGHYQPRVPADLGYYDLRVPETRKAQAELAKKYGIYGFCYWHYWFGDGKILLERPFQEVLKSGDPDFPFCLAWANESWKGFHHGLHNRNVLQKQKYGGTSDYISHFKYLLPAFKDNRYIKKDGKPIFVIYFPDRIPERKKFVEIWQNLAMQNDLPGIHFVGLSLNANEESFSHMKSMGMDALSTIRLEDFYGKVRRKKSLIQRIIDKISGSKIPPHVFDYAEVSKYFYNVLDAQEDVYPTIISGWDHSPRTGCQGLILKNYSPDVFEKHVNQILSLLKDKDKDNRFVFLKSWNEWAEGNYMEPDLRYGHAFLERLNACLLKNG